MSDISKIKQKHISDTHRLNDTTYFYNYALLTSANLTIGIIVISLLYRK